MWAFVRRVLVIAEKEVRHVTRDPRTLIMAFAMPVAMLLLFGYGMSFDLDNLQVAEDQLAVSLPPAETITLWVPATAE